MKKLIAASLVLTTLSARAQTVFTYGKDSVSVKEFLKAYEKNNPGPVTDKAFREYLDLYIASRLKVAEAREKGYDTLPQLKADLQTLRSQILPAYLVDKESLNRLVDEAFRRSQKDRRVSHIFIAATPDPEIANKKLEAVKTALAKGESFADVARKYSDDPSAARNGGDLGYITVFSLPYELENLAYGTEIGSVSETYRSRAGFHLFRPVAERRALGRMKASQILLAFPPESSDAQKAAIRKLADSLYSSLKKGDDFGKLATRFSNDVVSAASSGKIPEFGTGDYDALFEETVFGLPKDGALSKPFLTAHGYHIVRRDALLPVAPTLTEAARDALRQRIENSDRMQTTKSALARKILKEAGYKKLLSNETGFWSYTDSVLYSLKPSHTVFDAQTPLFTFYGKTVTSADWIGYAQSFRYKSDGSGLKPYPALMDEFVESTALNYYQNNLEKFNEGFRQQLQEFKEGNLFFEIMQRQVWGPAQTDSAALENYYRAHRDSYTWKQSADAVIFYASDAASAKTFSEKLKKSPARWREAVESMSEKIAADSARFESSQLPNPTGVALKPGALTAPQLNKSDNSLSFAYVVKFYDQPQARSFQDAKGLVINDYQNELEKAWMEQLRKKYPVTINEAVVAELMAKRK